MDEVSIYPRKAAYDEIWFLNVTVDRLGRAASLDGLKSTLEDALEILGVRHFAYFWFCDAMKDGARPLVVTNIDDPPWLAAYQMAHQRLTAWAGWCSLRPTPFRMTDVETAVAASPGRRAPTPPAGYGDALIVPVHNPGNDVALMYLPTAGPPTAANSLFDALQHYIHVIAIHFHAAVTKLRECIRPEDASIRLTRRERDCLTWLAQGKTSWEVSVILDIAERTVNFHVSNAMMKLGVHNRTHAIAKALAMGLIDA